MKILFDLFPVILFFATFRYFEGHADSAVEMLSHLTGPVTKDVAPILLATVVVMIASVGQFVWIWLKKGKIGKTLKISLVLVVFFGALTLLFQDDGFIRLKPTILYWLFAAMMLFTALILKKSAMKAMLEADIALPEGLWRQIDWIWIVFFLLMGAANLFVAFYNPFCSDAGDCRSQWVTYKLISLAFPLIVIAIQTYLMMPYLEEKE